MKLTRQICESRRDAIEKGGLEQNTRVVLFSSCKDTPASVQLYCKIVTKGHPEFLFHQSLVFLLGVAVLLKNILNIKNNNRITLCKCFENLIPNLGKRFLADDTH